MNETTLAHTGKERSSKAPFLFSLAILAMLGLCYWLIPPFQNGVNDAYEVLTSKDELRIKEWVSRFGLAGPVILVLLMVAQMFLFVVPNILVMMVAITCYGPVWGGIISLLGVYASSSLGYMIGRFIGPSIVNKFISVKVQEKISAFIKSYGVPAIAITRLSSLSNDSLSFVTGILKMDYWKYILATLAGITPLIVLLAVYGGNGQIEKALIWIAGISLVLFVVYIVIDKRRKKRRTQATPHQKDL